MGAADPSQVGPTVTTSPTEPAGEPGAHLGEVVANRFRLVARIHTSSTGAVYRAEDLALARPVALRLLTPILSRDTALLERLQDRLHAGMRMARDEVRVLGDIVDLIDLGRSDSGQVFVVTDFIHGENLAEQVAREGALSWTVVRPLMVRACQILHLSHEHGAVRLDLQTRHLFPVRDKTRTSTLKILSPGLQLDPALSPEMIRYAAPEQITRGACDRRTDVYALGVIMYELLTGQAPFADAVPAVVLARHLLEPPPPLPVHLRDEIPAAVLAIVHRALAKQPAERWPTMKAMANAMAAIDFGPCDASGTLEVVDGEPLLPSASSASMRIDPAAAHGAATPAVRPRTFPPLQNAFADTAHAELVADPPAPVFDATDASAPHLTRAALVATASSFPQDPRASTEPSTHAPSGPASPSEPRAPRPADTSPADPSSLAAVTEPSPPTASALPEPSTLTSSEPSTRAPAPSSYELAASSEPSALTEPSTLTRAPAPSSYELAASSEPSALTEPSTLTRAPTPSSYELAASSEPSALTEPSTLTRAPTPSQEPSEPSAFTEPSTLTRAPRPAGTAPAEPSAFTAFPASVRPAARRSDPTADSSSVMAWEEILAAAEEAIAIVATAEHSGTAGDSGVFIPESLLRTGGAASASMMRGRRPSALPEPSLAETVVLPMSLVRPDASAAATMQLGPDDMLPSSASMSAARLPLGPDDVITASHPVVRPTRPPPVPLDERITTAYPTVSSSLHDDLPAAVTAALTPPAPVSVRAPLTSSGEHPHESVTSLRVASDERPPGVWPREAPAERAPWLAWAAGVLLFIGVGLLVTRLGDPTAPAPKTAANRPAPAEPAPLSRPNLSSGTAPKNTASDDLSSGPATNPPAAPAVAQPVATDAPPTQAPSPITAPPDTRATPDPLAAPPNTRATSVPAPTREQPPAPAAKLDPPPASDLPAKTAAEPPPPAKTTPRSKPRPPEPAPASEPPAPKRKTAPGAQAPDAGHEVVGGDDPQLAASLLRSAEQSAARGEHGQALGLATQSFHATPSTRALQIAGEAACKLGNVGKARWARQHLAADEREPVDAACTAAGVALD